MVEASTAERSNHDDSIRIEFKCGVYGQFGVGGVLGGGKPTDVDTWIGRSRSGEPCLAERVTVANDDVTDAPGFSDGPRPAVGGYDLIRRRQLLRKKLAIGVPVQHHQAVAHAMPSKIWCCPNYRAADREVSD